MPAWTPEWPMIEKDWRVRKNGNDRKLWRLLTAFLAALPIFPVHPVLAQGEVGRRIDARLNTVPFNRQFWGIALVDENGRLVYGRNESRLFVPASNTKLIVSAVASALLPPDWRAKTSVYGGAVVGGVLQGDLVLYGRGDPTMDKRCYAADSTLAGVCDVDPFVRVRQLAEALRARGVRV